MRDRAASTSGPECRSACDRRSRHRPLPPACRHCERSEAIQSRTTTCRIAALRPRLPQNIFARRYHGRRDFRARRRGRVRGCCCGGRTDPKAPRPAVGSRRNTRQTPCRADVHRSRVSACHLGADPGFCILASSANEGFGIKSASTRSIVPMRGGTASTSGPESRSSSESRCWPSPPSPVPVPVPVHVCRHCERSEAIQSRTTTRRIAAPHSHRRQRIHKISLAAGGAPAGKAAAR